MAISGRSNSLYGRELLNGGYYPKTDAYYYKEWNDFKMQFHAHNNVEIMYVINGKCLVETREACINMKKGEFILLDANVEHRLQVEKDMSCRMLNIEFGFNKENTMLPSFGAIAECNETLTELLKARHDYVVLRDSEEIYVTLKSLIMELDRGNSIENLLVQLLFDQLFIRISRLYCENIDKSIGSGVVHLKKAIQFMYQHYDRNIHIKDIAAAANVHAGYLHRIFKGSKGITINDYLTNIRINKAKSLLANTDIPITDISEYVGIGSRQYFAFIFKKLAGCSPSKYRKTAIKPVLKH